MVWESLRRRRVYSEAAAKGVVTEIENMLLGLLVWFWAWRLPGGANMGALVSPSIRICAINVSS